MRARSPATEGGDSMRSHLTGFVAGVLVVAVSLELLTRMVELSLRCGVPMVWVVNRFEPLVVVHRKGRTPEYLNGGMHLSGDPELPGFRCPVAEIFE
jgi:Uma2 family endonuclease